MHPKDVVEEYYANVVALDIDRWIALFADDAVMIQPDGREVEGKADLRAYESEVFRISLPKPTVTAIISGDRDAASEVEVTLPAGGVMKLAGIFQLDDSDRIRRLSIYCKIG